MGGRSVLTWYPRGYFNHFRIAISLYIFIKRCTYISPLENSHKYFQFVTFVREFFQLRMMNESREETEENENLKREKNNSGDGEIAGIFAEVEKRIEH